MALALGLAMPPAAPRPSSPRPGSAAGRALAELVGDAGGDLAGFYARRGYEPLWVGRTGAPRAGAVEALGLIASARADQLDPLRYAIGDLRARLAAAGGGPVPAMQAELALSRSVAAWAHDLHTPPRGAGLIFADPDLAPPSFAAGQVLERLAGASSLAAGLAALHRMNPIYEGIRQALAETDDARGLRVLRGNLERARGLPADFGPRYILVDIAAQRLEFWSDRRLVDTMPVVVGKPSQPTPALAGMLRFAVRNPYWHMPPDLAADRIAPAVLRSGPRVLADRGLELRSDFSAQSRVVQPEDVDWEAVAAGRGRVYVRERPGPANMMGRIKFIFPNRYGIYLHDTPARGLFARDARFASSGCVRLSDAGRLARHLFGGSFDLAGTGRPEERVDLPTPIPVYLVYLTTRPTAAGIAWRPDVYSRDAATDGEMPNEVDRNTIAVGPLPRRFAMRPCLRLGRAEVRAG